MNSMSELSVADKIRAKRNELNLTYRDLEQLTGISRTSLMRYETGEVKSIPISKIKTIAGALNVDVAWLVGWKETTEELDQKAELLAKVTGDKELQSALKIYYSLSREKQASILDYINFVGK